MLAAPVGREQRVVEDDESARRLFGKAGKSAVDLVLAGRVQQLDL